MEVTENKKSRLAVDGHVLLQKEKDRKSTRLNSSHIH